MLFRSPYVFDWENAIALHAMQGTRASSRGEGEDILQSLGSGREGEGVCAQLCVCVSCSRRWQAGRGTP